MQMQIGRVDLRGDEQLIHDETKPLRLVLDHLEELVAHVIRQCAVLLPQRANRAVHGGERRAQLVCRGRDELGAQPLEADVVGDVAEDDHAAVLELRLRQREPHLAPLERHRPRAPVPAGIVELVEHALERGRRAVAR